MFRFATTTVCGLLLAVPVLAQDVTHSTAIGLGYNRLKVDGETVSGPSLELESGLQFGQVDVGVDFGTNRLARDGVTLDQFSTEIAPTYWFNPAFGAGAYVAHDKIDVDTLFDASATSYGVEAALKGGAFSGALFLGQTDLEAAGVVEGTTRDMGLRARVDVSPEVSLWTSAVQSKFDDVGGDDTTWGWSVGGSAMVSDGFGVFASYQAAGLDGGAEDIGVGAVGLTWTTQVGGQGVMLSTEYASGSGDSVLGDAKGDRLSVGATILLGEAKRKRTPAHAVSNAALRGDRNALLSQFSAIGF